MRTSPEGWRDWVRPDQAQSSTPTALDRAVIQSFRGTDPLMRQPPLDHHVFVLHEGGNKRVVRRSGRRVGRADVQDGAFTTIESGSAYVWQTEGPIAFSHIYVRPDRFAEVIGDAFGRDPKQVGLAETIGVRDPQVESLFRCLLDMRGDPDWDATADYLLDALLVRVASVAGREGEFGHHGRLSLTKPVIRRVQDYVCAHIAERITLTDLAEVAGYSRYHFVRAFRHSVGEPPISFVGRERVRHAQELLVRTDDPVAEIARASGFVTHAHFTTRFRAISGLTPVEFRRRARNGTGGDTD